MCFLRRDRPSQRPFLDAGRRDPMSRERVWLRLRPNHRDTCVHSSSELYTRRPPALLRKHAQRTRYDRSRRPNAAIRDADARRGTGSETGGSRNQDADSIVPLLKNGEVGLEHGHMRKPSGLGPANGGHPPALGSPARWLYWRFPQDKLAELKRIASPGPTARVSTNDAVTAFFTQRLTAVRIASGRVSREESIHCLRAADGRSRLNPPVPKGYLGHLVGLAYTQWPVASIFSDSPLSTVAGDLRSLLEEVDDFNIRSLATLIHTTEDKSTIFYGAKKKLGKDIFISSWALMDLGRSCNFGPLLSGDGKDGRPDFVRRAKMDIVPDLTYIMPRDRNGHVDIGACPFEEDIEDLEHDEMWKTYTKMIG